MSTPEILRNSVISQERRKEIFILTVFFVPCDLLVDEAKRIWLSVEWVKNDLLLKKTPLPIAPFPSHPHKKTLY